MEVKSKKEISHRQKAILNSWLNTNNNLLIKAGAGAGKTTTLFLLMENTKERILFLAFNKSIQETIQNKIEKNNIIYGKALTIHSIGFKTLLKSNKYNKVVVKNGKKYDIYKKVEKEHYKTLIKISYPEKIKLKMTIFNLYDMSRYFLTTDLKELQLKFNTFGISFINNELLKTLKILWETFIKYQKEYYTSKTLIIDFTDMIYLPYIFNLDIPITPKYLFIDEAQDLSLLHHKFIEKYIEQKNIKRWVAVGDENQAIYGFAGSLSNSMEYFKNNYKNVEELPLDICYRCDLNIIEKANEVYNTLVPYKKSKGVVEVFTKNFKDIEENSLVICRNAEPLIDIYYNLLQNNKKVVVLGEDIFKPVLNFLQPYVFDDIYSFNNKVQNRLNHLKIKEENNIKKNISNDDVLLEKHNITKNIKSFHKVLQNTKNSCVKITEVIDIIKNYEKNNKTTDNSIILCTIHKSKGLEADVVYIVDEKLIPNKFAKTPEQLTQEYNLKYVARTRAINKLFYIDTSESVETII